VKFPARLARGGFSWENSGLLSASQGAGGFARTGRRIAVAGVLANGLLAAVNIALGLLGGSTSVVAAGLELAGDVLASAIVLLGMAFTARPPDANHPYGHGRAETLAGFVVGLILAAAGAGICFRSLQKVGETHAPPALYAVWPLLATIIVKSVLTAVKFRYGRRVRSAALVADAWNDSVDILAAAAALAALGLTLLNPAEFLAADHYGGFAVGLTVIFTGLRVVRDTSLQLMDTMPGEELMASIRRVALSVPDVRGVEKCYARKTGLQYHVDLHLEVDPGITVWESHEIATRVRKAIREQLDWIADVLVHVEPTGLEPR
jgi:cation diffusion facilitator family transporter